MKIAICDDDAGELKLIANEIERVANNKWNIEAKTYTSGNCMLKEIASEDFDAFLLDIDMPEINGLDLANKLVSYNRPIIFISNHEKYVFRAIRVAPFRFIRKEELQNELEEAISALQQKIENESVLFTFGDRNAIRKINLRDIMYIESKGHNIEVHTVKEVIIFREKISKLEKQLDDYGFARFHRGFIINMRYIAQLKTSNLKIDTGEELVIGPKYVDTIRERYNTYIKRNLNEIR